MKIEGRNPVFEALVAGKTIDRLVIQRGLKDAGAQKIIDEAKKRGVRITFYEKSVMDKESSGRHQGFIAEVTDFVYCEVEDILNYAKEKDQPPFVLLLDGVEDPHNLGSILRVAECAGVHGVVIPSHRSVTVNETVIKVSAGAANHVLVAKVTNINDAIDYLKKSNVWVYCADMSGDNLYKTNLTGAIGLVIGGEGKGVGTRTKSNCDGVVSIPLMGKVGSLNASTACAVVVFEKNRQSQPN